MEKGTPNMEAINKNMKKEMVDFVSFYRRFNNVSGKQSFSTLYTSINGMHMNLSSEVASIYFLCFNRWTFCAKVYLCVPPSLCISIGGPLHFVRHKIPSA